LRAFRRAVVAMGLAALGGVVLRLRGGAGSPPGTNRAATRVRAAASEGTGFSVTNALIVANIAAYLVQASGGGTFTNPAGEIFQKGYLRAFEVGAGEWWRLITYGFRPAGLLHIGFNMFLPLIPGRGLDPPLGPLERPLRVGRDLSASNLGG